MSIKNVAILGGAFDPVHQDHIALAKLCIEKGFYPLFSPRIF